MYGGWNSAVHLERWLANRGMEPMDHVHPWVIMEHQHTHIVSFMHSLLIQQMMLLLVPAVHT